MTGPQKHTIRTPNLRRYSPGCLGSEKFSIVFQKSKVTVSSNAGRNPAITGYGKYPMIYKALYIPGAGYSSINSMNHQLKSSNFFSYLRRRIKPWDQWWLLWKKYLAIDWANISWSGSYPDFVHQLYQPDLKSMGFHIRDSTRGVLEAKNSNKKLFGLSSPRVAGFQQNCCCTAPEHRLTSYHKVKFVWGFGHKSIPCNSANSTNFSQIAVSEKKSGYKWIL